MRLIFTFFLLLVATEANIAVAQSVTFEAGANLTAEVLFSTSGLVFTSESFEPFQDVFVDDLGFDSFAEIQLIDPGVESLSIGGVFESELAVTGETSYGDASVFGSQLSLITVFNPTDQLGSFSVGLDASVFSNTTGGTFTNSADASSALVVFFNGDPVSLLDLSTNSFTFLNNGRDELTEQLNLTTELAPGATFEIDVLSSVSGSAFAVHSVPEPRSLMFLFAVGSLAMTKRRRLR